MKVTIIGVRRVSFPDKQTGEMVEYTELHCTTPSQYVKGMSVLKVKCANSKAINLDIPADYDLDYGVLPSGKAQLLAINPVKA